MFGHVKIIGLGTIVLLAVSGLYNLSTATPYVSDNANHSTPAAPRMNINIAQGSLAAGAAFRSVSVGY
jgi:hypothetical protein